nr:Probable phospholipid ABC transporter permease protein mlaE [Klebsiella pneumoniae]
MQNAVDWRMDLVNCLIKSLVFAITVTGLRYLMVMTLSPLPPGLAGRQRVPWCMRRWRFWGWILC